MEQRLAWGENFVAQIANLRYSRMQFCATSAAFLDFIFHFPDKLFAGIFTGGSLIVRCHSKALGIVSCGGRGSPFGTVTFRVPDR